ncbi:hypothetical protein J3D55_001219 [Chryseobacterium ginsenosidimutans]|nr:hypothetical protein [Chryseobacterium ginsenosidimutans]
MLREPQHDIATNIPLIKVLIFRIVMLELSKHLNYLSDYLFGFQSLRIFSNG